MCFFHIRHSSISTPRILLISLVQALFHQVQHLNLHVLLLMSREVYIIIFVWLAFIDNLLALNQLFRSPYLFYCYISLCEYKIAVSSANKIKSMIFDVYVISLTYNIKSSGHSMEPCGIPLMIFSGFEVLLLNATYCVLLVR